VLFIYSGFVVALPPFFLSIADEIVTILIGREKEKKE